MKYPKLATLFILLHCSVALIAQDTLYIDKRQLSVNIYNTKNEKLNFNKLLKLSKENKDAKNYFAKAQANYYVGFVLGVSGGFIFGNQIAKLSFGNKIHTNLLLTSFGLYGLSLCFNSWTVDNLKLGVEHYNKPLRKNE